MVALIDCLEMVLKSNSIVSKSNFQFWSRYLSFCYDNLSQTFCKAEYYDVCGQYCPSKFYFCFPTQRSWKTLVLCGVAKESGSQDYENVSLDE